MIISLYSKPKKRNDQILVARLGCCCDEEAATMRIMPKIQRKHGKVSYAAGSEPDDSSRRMVLSASDYLRSFTKIERNNRYILTMSKITRQGI